MSFVLNAKVLNVFQVFSVIKVIELFINFEISFL